MYTESNTLYFLLIVSIIQIIFTLYYFKLLLNDIISDITNKKMNKSDFKEYLKVFITLSMFLLTSI